VCRGKFPSHWHIKYLSVSCRNLCFYISLLSQAQSFLVSSHQLGILCHRIAGGSALSAPYIDVSMSFGYSVDDILALIQLSWSVVEGATRACGKHDDLTKEVSSLHDVLAHVYSELSVAEPSFASARSSWKAELQSHLTGCDTQLRIINTVLQKFNALSSEQKFGRQLWSKIRFANGEDQDVGEIRSRMGTYSTAITMSLRLISLGSRGKIERQLSRQRGPLEGIRESVNLALAHINSTTRQKSLITGYSNDAKAFWSRLRRELTKDGFSRSAVNNKKDLILSYMKELDSRGVLGYSTSFQKAMNAQNEAKRQSNTPASFQSSSTLTGGRNSNSSVQSFGCRKDSGYCSSAFDEPVCMRTDSDLSWPDCRPVTAVEHDQNFHLNPTVTEMEPNEKYMESSSPSNPYRLRHEADSTLGMRTLNNEPANIPTQQIPVHSSSRHGSIANFSGHTSKYEVEQKIRLEDPHGREFSFPISQAKSWEVCTPNPPSHQPANKNREWKP
jgi:hypothetical protein